MRGVKKAAVVDRGAAPPVEAKEKVVAVAAVAMRRAS